MSSTPSDESSCSDSTNSSDGSDKNIDSDFEADNEDYTILNLHAIAPYQHEPLAIPGEPPYRFQDDAYGIPRETLASRYEKRISVNEWLVLRETKSSNLYSFTYL